MQSSGTWSSRQPQPKPATSAIAPVSEPQAPTRATVHGLPTAHAPVPATVAVSAVNSLVTIDGGPLVSPMAKSSGSDSGTSSGPPGGRKKLAATSTTPSRVQPADAQPATSPEHASLPEQSSRNTLAGSSSRPVESAVGSQ
jgi:hypothetical protein